MMTMKKFVHALNVVVAYIGMEKFGNAQIVTIQRKVKKQLPITGFPVVRSLFYELSATLLIIREICGILYMKVATQMLQVRGECND